MLLKQLIGYNIHAEVEYNNDGRQTPRNILYNHLDKTKPPFLLVLNRFSFALELAKRYPQTTIIVRYYPDDFHLTKSVDEYIKMVENDWNLAKSQGIKNLSFHTTNEPSKSKELIEWHVNVMNKAKIKNIPLTVLNLAIGAWNHNTDLEALEPILRLCAERPDLFNLGIHEYFCALPTSGMPELDSKGNPYFPIMPDEWKIGNDLTRWHCGRHQFLLDVCDKLNIARPNIVITEHGQDRLDENGSNWVAKWVYSLDGHIKGWKTSNNQWRKWFANYTTWFSEPYKFNKAYVYAQMLKYLQKTTYQSDYKGKSRNIKGVMLFSWWNSGIVGTSQDWTNFRVDDEPDFLRYIEELFDEKPVFENPKYNDSRWIDYRIRSKFDNTNVYKMPNNQTVASVNKTWFNVRLITFDNMSDSEKEVSKGEWFLFNTGLTVGWIKVSDIEIYVEPDNTEVLLLLQSSFTKLKDLENLLTTIKRLVE